MTCISRLPRAETGPGLHSSAAIGAAAWLARVFVDKARLSDRGFATHDAFKAVSIWNFSPTYTDRALPGINLWDQAYIFP